MSIDKIPEGQLCQAYDPLVIFKEKTVNILEDHMETNTSCVAPAYVYIEGSRGKRFLCDYHHGSELIITQLRTPHLWKNIEQYLIDERENIKETFDIKNNTSVTKDFNCWCGARSFVIIKNKETNNELYYCNFHYRKTYYRYLSNGKNFENIYSIIDERNQMTISIEEEIEIIKNNYQV